MSIFDPPEAVTTAPSWRCPHCRTLQPETSRCRACARAAVTCSTCYLYRSSVASDLGYCAHDRSRSPLRGDEVRSCWKASAVQDAAAGLFEPTDLAPAPPSPEADAPEVARSWAPPLEDLPLPAWSEATLPGRLVEAPRVDPRERLMSELERRSRRSRSR